MLNEVRPLTVEYAERLWYWVFQNETQRGDILFVAMNCKGWLPKLMSRTNRRYESGTALSSLLNQEIPWAANETVYFLQKSGTGYQTHWNVFTKYCDSFLGGSNEDGLLFSGTSREVAVFWEGAMQVGLRGERKLRSSANT